MAAPQVSELRKGDRVQLVTVPADPDYVNTDLKAGECGRVELVDAQRTVHVVWDRGNRHLGITRQHAGLLRRIR